MKKILFCISLLISSLLISCAGGAGGSDSSVETGRLAFSSARALATEKSDLQNFTLKGGHNGGKEKTLETWTSYAELKAAVVELEVGTWTFTLEGEYPSGKTYIYGGSTTARIKANEDTVVSFVLKTKGFAASEMGVNDILLSNGYACASSDLSHISGASAVGVAFTTTSGGRPLVVNTSKVRNCAGLTITQLMAWGNSVGDGWRLPDYDEGESICSKYTFSGSAGFIAGVPIGIPPETPTNDSAIITSTVYDLDGGEYWEPILTGSALAQHYQYPCNYTGDMSDFYWCVVVKEF